RYPAGVAVPDLAQGILGAASWHSRVHQRCRRTVALISTQHRYHEDQLWLLVSGSRRPCLLRCGPWGFQPGHRKASVSARWAYVALLRDILYPRGIRKTLRRDTAAAAQGDL